MRSALFRDVRSVLCLGAHADDLEIGCGGTLLELIRCQPQVEVHWVVFGAAGQRAAEAHKSAACLLAPAAAGHIAIHDFRDTFFPHVWGPIKESFAALQREVNPDLIFTHRREDLHQDHRVISELTWCAFRNHVILEYEIPKYEGDLGAPNLFVPLTEAACRRKVECILDAFPSQRASRWFTADTFWAVLRLRGVECQSPTGFAEGHYCRKIVADWGG